VLACTLNVIADRLAIAAEADRYIIRNDPISTD